MDARVLRIPFALAYVPFVRAVLLDASAWHDPTAPTRIEPITPRPNALRSRTGYGYPARIL